MTGLRENLQCKNHYFLTKWWDLLDLSKKILLDLVYMHPGGIHGKKDLCGGDGFFGKKKLAENLA